MLLRAAVLAEHLCANDGLDVAQTLGRLGGSWRPSVATAEHVEACSACGPVVEILLLPQWVARVATFPGFFVTAL